MSKFYSDKNLNLLVNISKKYFEDKYNFRINQDREIKELKDNIYEFMTEVNAECHDKPNIPFERKNIAVLNSIKEVYTKRYKLIPADEPPPVMARESAIAPAMKKPNMQALSRDQELYGNRPVKMSNNIIPDINPYQKRQPAGNPGNQVHDISRIIDNRNNEPFIDKKHNLDMSKLGPVTRDTAEENEVFMYKLQELEKQRAMLNIDNPQNPNDIISPITSNEVLQHYGGAGLALAKPMSPPPINFQSPLSSHPAPPPQVSLQQIINNMNNMDINSDDRMWWKDCPLRYQYWLDIKPIHINRLIIGKVIIPGIAFNYPYINIKIDEFPELYGKLIFNKSYITENGRGYIILEPEFENILTINKLVNKFTISFLKPNGQLLNNLSDHYKIITIELVDDRFKIITTRNDFILGDTILFKNVVTNNSSKEFNQFINSHHDIVEIIDANVFYIECPICVDANHKFENISGNVMNMYLQHTINLRVD